MTTQKTMNSPRMLWVHAVLFCFNAPLLAYSGYLIHRIREPPAAVLPACASCCPKPVPCRPLDMAPSEPPADMSPPDMSCAVCKDADGGSIGPCTPSRCARQPDGSYCCIGGLLTWPYSGAR